MRRIDVAPMGGQMEEVEYLRVGNVLVTSTRIEIDGQTFAVRNVGSVKVMKPGTPWIAGLVLVLALLMGSKPETRGALIVALAAAAWIWQQVKSRSLILVSGGGETLALKSTNPAFVESVRSAVAQAISAR